MRIQWRQRVYRLFFVRSKVENWKGAHDTPFFVVEKLPRSLLYWVSLARYTYDKCPRYDVTIGLVFEIDGNKNNKKIGCLNKNLFDLCVSVWLVTSNTYQMAEINHTIGSCILLTLEWSCARIFFHYFFFQHRTMIDTLIDFWCY